MNKLFYFLLLFLLTKGGISQNYFNNRYDFANGVDLGHDIHLLSSGNYMLPTLFREGSWSSRSIGFLIIDKEGNSISQTSFSETGFDLGTGWKKNICFLNQELYLNATRIGQGKIDGFLMKTDTLFSDTIWRKFYAPENYYSYNTACLVAPDSTLMLLGHWTDTSSWNYQVFLIKADTAGNVLWQKEYGGPDSDYGIDFNNTPDNGFIISSKRYVGFQWDPVIIKVDSAGDVQWQHRYGGTLDDGHANVAVTGDGGYAVSFWQGTGGEFGKVHLLKLNKDGNTVWRKSYMGNYYPGGQDYGGIVMEIQEQPDGSFLILTAEVNFSGMLKVSATGDSLWFRTYRKVNMAEDHTLPSTNYLFGFLVDKDDNNAIVCAGHVHPVPPADTGTQDVWVVKLDSLGCPFAGCDTIGQNTDDTSIEQLLVSDINMAVFPNPGTDYFNLQFLRSEPNLIILLSLYDMNGKECFSRQINSSEAFINEKITISHLPGGIYYLRVDNGKRILTKKVVKIK
jgi:hypothetical protein